MRGEGDHPSKNPTTYPVTHRGFKNPAVDPPLCSSHACLHGAFTAISVHQNMSWQCALAALFDHLFLPDLPGSGRSRAMQLCILPGRGKGMALICVSRNFVVGVSGVCWVEA